MTNENPEIRGIINRDLAGIIEGDMYPFETSDSAGVVVRGLVGNVLGSVTDPELGECLEIVHDLITSRAISLQLDLFKNTTTDLEKDILLVKSKSAEKGTVSLGILINPTVLSTLDSTDDRGFAVARMKDVMLEVYFLHRELAERGEFLSMSDYLPGFNQIDFQELDFSSLF